MTMLSSIGRATAHIVELDYSISPSLGLPCHKTGCDFRWLRTRNSYIGLLFLYYLGASPRGRGRSAVNRLQLKTHRRFKSFRARHFKVGNMSRDKTEYQISKIGHVQHSRLVLRHAIQMILYGRIIDYYSLPFSSV